MDGLGEDRTGAGPPAQLGHESRPSWSAQSDVIARRIGFVFVGAGATGLLSMLFPPSRYGSVPLTAVAAVTALGVGTALLLGRVRAGSVVATQAVLAFATLLVSVSVYASGAPSSGAMFFYLWATPYAFALFTRAQASIQTLWMAVCAAVVLVIQMQIHPGIGTPADLAGMWFLAVATVIAVGTLVRGLSRSLRDVDRRFHRAFQDSRVGAAFVSTDGRWLDVNDALCRMLGREPAELLGTPLVSLTIPEDRGSTTQAIGLATKGFTTYEKRYLRPDGAVVWVEVSASLITPEIGAPYLFAQYRDLTAHRHDRDTLAYQAVHDPLTGLFNRTLLLDRLQTALARGDQVAVILLDLDGFKVVNDSLGHHAGDGVLTALAPRLEAATQPTDTLARLGGDEFVVLCERLAGPLDAVDRAARLAAAVTEPFELDGGRHSVTASLGVAVSDGPADTATTLLRDADAAMYRAKAKGRGQVELFDHTMRDEAVARLQLEHDLRLAIDEEQFVLEYQPIVDTVTLAPVALEALIRWNHPTRGLLAPASFIPLAEETGLIDPIGDWVLDTACTQLAAWQESAGLRTLKVAVNVSPVQLASAGFAPRVARVLRRSRLTPGSLCLEITENVILATQAPAAALTALKALGTRIFLDDFGTGYSSLAYLTRFPIDTLKIDQAFIAALDGSAHSSAITKAIIALAHELDLGVVGEGVETTAQLEQLRRLHCPAIQGYVISRPIPAASVPAYLVQFRPQPALTGAA